jgi:hypothetical protein
LTAGDSLEFAGELFRCAATTGVGRASGNGRECFLTNLRVTKQDPHPPGKAALVSVTALGFEQAPN